MYGNDWYCPSDCDLLEEASKLDYDIILKAYARNDGDLNKVCRYLITAANKPTDPVNRSESKV